MGVGIAVLAVCRSGFRDKHTTLCGGIYYTLVAEHGVLYKCRHDVAVARM